ncbi:MAG TPA: hypothetical protein DDZ80_13315 [Cyanobacteria bacterium UBA8803]|nr:hypothetical protein [Cyanobacteria bacterium UBA9273]HBL59450.1 hypothetical protein [Cyanobacteria bacterium UBA8803]
MLYKAKCLLGKELPITNYPLPITKNTVFHYQYGRTKISVVMRKQVEESQLIIGTIAIVNECQTPLKKPDKSYCATFIPSCLLGLA